MTQKRRAWSNGPGKIQAATKKMSDVVVEGEERWRGVEV